MSAQTTNATRFQRYLYRNYRSYSGTLYWIRRRLTGGGIIVLLGLVGTSVLGVDTNLSLAYRAFAFLFCLLFVALVGSRFSRANFTARRELPRFASVGKAVNYRVVVQNETKRPQRGVVLREDLADPRPTLQEFVETPEPGERERNWFDRTYAFYRWQWLVAKNRRGTVEEQACPALTPRGEAELKVELTPLRRGVLRFTGVTLACPDPFGLFRSLVTVPLADSLLILPKRYPLAPLALPGTLKYQPGGVTLAAAVGESEEFVSLRDYRPGDPLRHVHWKSWAKTGKPIVKEFLDEFFVRHALILDTFGDEACSEVFEEAVSVAASFACSVQTQESLLDLMFVGPQAYCFTAGRGLAHTEQMLEILASVNVCRERQFNSLVQLVIQHLDSVSGCICVLIAWDAQRQQFVQHLRLLGVPVLVLVLTEAGGADQLKPGPMADCPENFHVLEVGKVGEGLARL